MPAQPIPPASPAHCPSGQCPDCHAHAAIHALVAAYSDAVNRRDADSWAACWAPDAVWRLRGAEVAGRDQILAAWRRAMDGFAQVWFMAFIGHLDLAGDEARLRTHTFEYLNPATGKPRLQSGLYEDHVILRDGRWLFASRSFSSQELPL